MNEAAEWAPKCCQCRAPREEVQIMFAVIRTENGYIPFTTDVNGTDVFLTGGRARDREDVEKVCRMCASANAGEPEAEAKKLEAIGPDGSVEWECRACFSDFYGPWSDQ